MFFYKFIYSLYLLYLEQVCTHNYLRRVTKDKAGQSN